MNGDRFFGVADTVSAAPRREKSIADAFFGSGGADDAFVVHAHIKKHSKVQTNKFPARSISFLSVPVRFQIEHSCIRGVDFA